jgi:hypothetical protein
LDLRAVARLEMILQMLKTSVPLAYCALLYPARDLFIHDPNPPDYLLHIHESLPQIAVLTDKIVASAVWPVDEIIVTHHIGNNPTYTSIRLINDRVYLLCTYHRLGDLINPWLWYQQAVDNILLVLSRME